MAKAAERRWGCHDDRLLSEADTQGSVVVPVCVTVLLSDLHRLLQGCRVLPLVPSPSICIRHHVNHQC